MKITVIISYYKAIENLKLILKAFNFQSFKNFEVIVSEDDFNKDTINFLEQNYKNYRFKIHHLHQNEDRGFRKNQMLNRSILYAKTDKIVFIDGDCIPHKHFVKEYVRTIKKGFFYSGRSVLLSKKISDLVLQKQSISRLNLLNLIFYKSKQIKSGIYFPFFPLSYKKRGLLGRNWGIDKQHLIEINGFDEDYITAGVGEDTDIAWRLVADGLKLVSVKNKAIVYHLFHKKHYTNEIVSRNLKMMKEKQRKNLVVCINGLKKTQLI